MTVKFPSSHVQAVAEFWSEGTHDSAAGSSQMKPWNRKKKQRGEDQPIQAVYLQHQLYLWLHSSLKKMQHQGDLIKYMWLQWIWTGRSKASNLCLDVTLLLLCNAFCVVSDWLRNGNGGRVFILNDRKLEGGGWNWNIFPSLGCCGCIPWSVCILQVGRWEWDHCYCWLQAIYAWWACLVRISARSCYSRRGWRWLRSINVDASFTFRIFGVHYPWCSCRVVN